MTTKEFPGFPGRGRLTPLPNVFFTSVLPYIEDIAELKATLHVFWAVCQKKGYPRFVTRNELLTSDSLVLGLDSKAEAVAAALDRAMAAATRRGTLLHIRLDRDERTEDLYFLNTEADRRAVDAIGRGELIIGGLAIPAEPSKTEEERRDIFSLYEANIGMLTPMIAEELKDAETQYPAEWIEDAFREAVALNKRSWRYVARILERWSTEGKQHGRPGKYSEKTDPGRYFRGKYGRLVRGR
jgi:DnaD/phage-associated family protein